MSRPSDIGEQLFALIQQRSKARGLLPEGAEDEPAPFVDLDEQFRREFTNIVRRSLGGASDETLEDRAHNVFLALWEAKSYAKGPGQAVEFVRTVARNRAIDEYRRPKRMTDDPPNGPPLVGDEQPDSPLALRDMRRVVQRALAMLVELQHPQRVHRANEYLSHQLSLDTPSDDPGPSFSPLERKMEINRVQKARSQGRAYLLELLMDHSEKFEDEELALLRRIVGPAKKGDVLSEEDRGERLEMEESP